MVNIKDKGMEKFFIGVDVSKKTLDCVTAFSFNFFGRSIAELFFFS